MNNIKKKFRSQKPVFGAWMSFGHPQIAEAFCSIMKPDFLSIDLEHSTIHQEQTQRIIAAGQAHGIPVLPRVSSLNEIEIRQVLDSGADGVMVPMVNSKEEVKRIVDCLKFPPQGKRSFGVARAHGYGARFEEYIETWNERATLIIQIESMEGVEVIDALVAQPEVDAVMIGPYDISGSLGIPGQLEDPKVLKACDRVVQACERHHKGCGTQIVNPDAANVQNALDHGYTFIVLASDVFLMWKWSEEMRHLIEHVRPS